MRTFQRRKSINNNFSEISDNYTVNILFETFFMLQKLKPLMKI